MPHTANTLYLFLTQGNKLSHASRVDYGLDPCWYGLFRDSLTQENRTKLLGRYLELVLTGTTSDDLHTAFMNQKLGDLLGPGFEWVRTSYHFPSN